MRTISVVEARRRFSEIINRVVHRHERIVISRRGRPVAAVINLDDLARLGQMPDNATPVELPSNETWLQGRRDFIRLLPELRRTHMNRWVAVVNGQMVDSDEDQEALRKRVESTYPDQVIFISQVKEEALPPLRLPHARVVP